MPAGIYLHIPFCKSRCSYCDFATDVFRSESAVDRYVSALIAEIERFGQAGLEADTIYFGGGTPSLLPAVHVERILDSIRAKFRLEPNTEITLEMNPATVSPEKLNGYRSLGINRASFGVQTFDDHALRLLARGHDSSDALKTYELLRNAGFENISFDLIAGLPGQTLRNWEDNIEKAIALDPAHISLYILEIHQATPLAEQIRSKRQPLPDEELAAAMYEMMLEKLDAAGFRQYEISNFSRPGFESRHNSKYWRCEAVFGFGVSAHSFDGNNLRYSNERDTNRYVSLIEGGISPVAEKNELTEKQLSGEFAFLNLRLSEGLNLENYASHFGHNLLEELGNDLRQMEEAGLIKIAENRLRLTRKGMVFSNEVFEIFV